MPRKDRRFYVYVLLDPRFRGRHSFSREARWNYQPYYIGKGTGKRLSTHVYQQLHEIGLYQREQEIKDAGHKPIRRKFKADLTEEEAFALEARLISDIGRLEKGTGPLVNQTEGNMPRAAEPIKIFKGTFGLSAKVEPARVFYDPETGLVDCAELVNMDVDDSGAIETRPGTTATAITDAVHSMWSDGGLNAFYVSGTTLYRLLPGFGSIAIKADMQAGIPVDFEKVGDDYYWTSQFQHGIINGVANSSWAFGGTYYGPNTSRSFSSPPLGTKLMLHQARMHILDTAVVWYSEEMAYNVFDLADNYLPLPSAGRFIKSIHSGFFVGHNDGVDFYLGRSATELSIDRVSPLPPVAGTEVVAPANLIKSAPQEKGFVLLWVDDEGIKCGMSDGTVLNLTIERLDFPRAVTGCAAFHRGKYICLLTP